MTAPGDTSQRITVLAPVAEVLSRLDGSVSPVAATNAALDDAIGATLAEDVVAPADFPPRAAALHDGWAVASEQTADASAYAPVLLNPAPVWVNAADPMPSGADAVLPFDAVSIAGAGAEIHVPAAKGEGVLPARFDAAKGTVLRRAGERVRPLDVALMRVMAIETIAVRFPRVKIFSVSLREAGNDATGSVIARAVRTAGGKPEVSPAATLEAAFSNPDCDAVITIGGTGTGKNDVAVSSLARIGKLEFHGMGISPGQTAAFGSVKGCPVLMLPGRFDAALAGFLVAGRRLMMRLSGSSENETGIPVPLAKKITSPIGLTEVVFVKRVPGGVEPLGGGAYPLHVLTQADGWVLVPAESEGFAAGAAVEMRSLL
jgi:molybdopterin molybdotransferase